ncbi:Six-hairpin glycosidase-like protein [Xylariaceae sp. FL0016]|nr:Six-hairpin glycosidase-like protein [Xylariaceae sp. FL0016]
MTLDFEQLIPKVVEQAERLATHSWEYGTLSETLLELFSPEVSVFGSQTFPYGSIPIVDPDSNRALIYARTHIKLGESNLIGKSENCPGASEADPASLGVMAVMVGRSDSPYMIASDKQCETLLRSTPRMENGAISHKAYKAEAWSDYVYMVPPFLAYYGVAKQDTDLIMIAVQQCQLYADILQDHEKGLWRHIEGLTFQDRGFWSTGNGWVALGVTRVLATLNGAGLRDHHGTQLTKMVKTILDGVLSYPKDHTGLLRNYIGDDTVAWFGEVAGTAALTAAIYRFAVLSPHEVDHTHIAWADDSRNAVIRHVDSMTGKISPVVNPRDTKDENPKDASAEGQCFALMMFAAHRDYLAFLGN